MTIGGWLRVSVLLVGLQPLACGGGGGGSSSGGEGGAAAVPPASDLARDILHTGLEVDLAQMTAKATIDLGPSPNTGATFEAGGLTIKSVTGDAGELQWVLGGGKLDLGVPVKTDGPTRVVIEYGFSEQNQFEGLMSSGSTLVWPYYCGNLFPCHSNPADGTTFDLAVTGAPAGAKSVYPASIPADAPSYQIAWATGDYQMLDLGTTINGLHVVAHYKTGNEANATKGTAVLKQVFEFYETKYGAYPFGAEAGAVEVDWGAGAYGGMEHHPLFHISTPAMGDPWIHAHEAAHGWFGDGARIACWEDVVLSEGTVSYLEARAIAAVMGAAEGQKVWDHYKTRLDAGMAGPSPKIVWPEGCGQIDVLKDLFSDLVYMKGAFFFKALEAKIGEDLLDKALQAFFVKYKNDAATFADLLAVVKSMSAYDATDCANAWLRSEAVPMDAACP